MSNTCEWSSEYEMELNALNPSSLLSNNVFETSKTYESNLGEWHRTNCTH